MDYNQQQQFYNYESNEFGLNNNDDVNNNILITNNELPWLFQQSIPSTSTLPTYSTPPAPAISENATTTAIESTGKRVASCAACRVRRVKCERTESSACNQCLKKGLSCVAMPKNPSKKVNRTGKRIQQVQALFGNGNDSIVNDTTTNDTTIKKRKVNPELSNTSVVSRLITTELEGVLSASLLNLFHSLPQSRVPLLEKSDLRAEFEKSGRRISQMSEQAEVLCSVIISIAARVSLHPLLIGSNPPSSIQLANDSAANTDLTEYGKKRSNACETLTQVAMNLADTKRTLRIASLESIGSLMLLEGLVLDQPDGEEAARSYSSAYMSHIRYLLDSDERQVVDKVFNSGIGWMAYVKDCMNSAWNGSSMTFPEDDIPLLNSTGSEEPPPLKELFTLPGGNGKVDGMYYKRTLFWTLFRSYMFHITSTAGLIVSKLTSPRAKRKPRIDELFIQDFLERIDLGVLATEYLYLEAKSFYGDYQSTTDEGKACYGFVGGLISARCGLTFLLSSYLGDTLKGRAGAENLSKVTELSAVDLSEFVRGIGMSEEELYWKRIENLNSLALVRAVKAAREVCSGLRNEQEGRVAGVGIMSGIHQLYSRLPDIAILISRFPTFEEGGILVDFSFDSKLIDLRTIQQALFRIGYAFSKLSISSIPLIEAEIEKTSLAKLLYQYNATPTLSLPPLDNTSTSSSNSTASNSAFSPNMEFDWNSNLSVPGEDFNTFQSNDNLDSLESIMNSFTAPQSNYGEFGLDSMVNGNRMNSIGFGNTEIENDVSVVKIQEYTTNKTKLIEEAEEADRIIIDLFSNLLR